MIARKLTAFAAQSAFQQVEVTGLEHSGDNSIDIIVGDSTAPWTGTLLIAATLPLPCTGLIYDVSGRGRGIAEALNWIKVADSSDYDSGFDLIDAILPQIKSRLSQRSTLVLCGRTFPDPTFAAALALTLAAEYSERAIRLIPAGIRRVVKPKAREQVLVQLGSATQVNALRVGHKWQRRQRAAELTRLVEESQAAMYVVTDDWNVLRSWDAICRLHRRQQVSGWSLGTSQKMYGLLVEEPDGQQLVTRVQNWLDALDGAELSPSDLDRSVKNEPFVHIRTLFEMLLLPLVIIGLPLFRGFYWVGRLSTKRMHDSTDWSAWRILFFSNVIMATSLLIFCLGVGSVHGWGYGGGTATLLLATRWVTRRIVGYERWPIRLWRRIRCIGARHQVHSWAWQERASLSETIQIVLSRPRGDDPPLFPKTIFDR
jgi:hypothetical protein